MFLLQHELLHSHEQLFSCSLFPLQHEQLRSHEHHVSALEQELQLHRAAAPEKGSKSTTISSYIEKESYLEFEVRHMSASCSESEQ